MILQASTTISAPVIMRVISSSACFLRDLGNLGNKKGPLGPWVAPDARSGAYLRPVSSAQLTITLFCTLLLSSFRLRLDEGGVICNCLPEISPCSRSLDLSDQP